MAQPLSTCQTTPSSGKTFILVMLFILTGFSSLFSQSADSVCTKLAERMEKLAHNNAPELIYIQPSKGIYEICEDLWFKTYVLDAQFFTSSPVSKTLYMQLIHEASRKVVWQEKYELNNGVADGHIFLSDTLAEGNYFLAAYTPFSFFADKTEMKAARRVLLKKEVTFKPADYYKPSPLINAKQIIHFSAFPEGGNWVTGIPGKMAYKAINTDGTPANVEGTLWEDSTLLQKFKSIHAGMGSFGYTPIAGKKYGIRLSGQDTLIRLPEAQPQGITLQLAGRSKEFLEFLVSQSDSLPERPVYLRAQMRGMNCCIATATLKKKLIIRLPLKEFPCQGIAEVTLFADSLTPIASRLVYVNPEKSLFIEAHLDKERYLIREKAVLKIKATDENGSPVEANLGINVFDKLFQNTDDPENILSHCLITSQLKGKIYNPAYYFDPKNLNRADGLDLLLLTQGWSRYVWSEVALQENDNKNQPVIFDGIRGEVHVTRQKQEVKGTTQIIKSFNIGNNTKTNLIATDTLGQFTVSPEILKEWQGGYFYLKPLLSDEFSPSIDIKEPFGIINGITKVKEINYPLPAPTLSKPTTFNEPVVKSRRVVKLGAVTVKGRTSTTRGRYRGTGTKGHYYCVNLILDCDYHRNAVNNTVLSEAEYLKIVNYTCIKAYAAHREFYEPKYDIVDSLNFPQGDYRNTLLWKPMVKTDEKGEASVPFFCSDINTGFVVNIEGLSKGGLPGASKLEFFVSDPKLHKKDITKNAAADLR